MKKTCLVILLFVLIFLINSCAKKNPTGPETPDNTATLTATSTELINTATVTKTATDTRTVTQTGTDTATETVTPTFTVTPTNTKIIPDGIYAYVQGSENDGSENLNLGISNQSTPIAIATAVCVNNTKAQTYYLPYIEAYKTYFLSNPSGFDPGDSYTFKVYLDGLYYEASGTTAGDITFADDGLFASWTLDGTNDSASVLHGAAGAVFSQNEPADIMPGSVTVPGTAYEDPGAYIFTVYASNLYSGSGIFDGVSGKQLLAQSSKYKAITINTATGTFTATPTPLNTSTITQTHTVSPTFTDTPENSQTCTATPTNTPFVTPTSTMVLPLEIIGVINCGGSNPGFFFSVENGISPIPVSTVIITNLDTGLSYTMAYVTGTYKNAAIPYIGGNDYIAEVWNQGHYYSQNFTLTGPITIAADGSYVDWGNQGESQSLRIWKNGLGDIVNMTGFNPVNLPNPVTFSAQTYTATGNYFFYTSSATTLACPAFGFGLTSYVINPCENNTSIYLNRDTATCTATMSPTITVTDTPEDTFTATETATATVTETITLTVTLTATSTFTSTVTQTSTTTATPTYTNTTVPGSITIWAYIYDNNTAAVQLLCSGTPVNNAEVKMRATPLPETLAGYYSGPLDYDRGGYYEVTVKIGDKTYTGGDNVISGANITSDGLLLNWSPEGMYDEILLKDTNNVTIYSSLTDTPDVNSPISLGWNLYRIGKKYNLTVNNQRINHPFIDVDVDAANSLFTSIAVTQTSYDYSDLIVDNFENNSLAHNMITSNGFPWAGYHGSGASSACALSICGSPDAAYGAYSMSVSGTAEADGTKDPYTGYFRVQSWFMAGDGVGPDLTTIPNQSLRVIAKTEVIQAPLSGTIHYFAVLSDWSNNSIESEFFPDGVMQDFKLRFSDFVLPEGAVGYTVTDVLIGAVKISVEARLSSPALGDYAVVNLTLDNILFR